MTYKKYKINKKNVYPNHIKFELNDNVEFSNGNHNFICCVNGYPFINYQRDDEIEVNLVDTKHVNSYYINQHGTVRKTSKSILGEDVMMDDYNPQQEEGKIQEQITLTLLVSAYDKKATHKKFRGSLEWLEKYIGVVYSEFYPDWQTRKKIHDKSIKRQDANDPNRVKSLLSSSLFGLKTMMEVIGGDKQSKQSLYDEMKKEYYEWLGAIEINPNNCPLELKHFLFEVNEILEGRGDKLERDIENKKWEIDPNSVEYEKAFSKLFTSIGVPLENERNEYENLKGKTQKDITITNNFGGNSEPVEQAFKQMAGKHDYQGFYFVPQKDTQTTLQEQSSSSFQQRPSSVIVRNVKQNPNDWRKDEVITEYDNFGNATKREMALIHNSAEVGFSGVVYNWQQPIYLPQKFNQTELSEINQALGISRTPTSTNYQKNRSFLDETNNSTTLNNSNLGTISLITVILALMGLGIYGIVKKAKKKIKR